LHIRTVVLLLREIIGRHLRRHIPYLITSLFMTWMDLCHRIRRSFNGNTRHLNVLHLIILFYRYWCFSNFWTLNWRFLQRFIGFRLVSKDVILILFGSILNTLMTPYCLHFFFCLKSRFYKNSRWISILRYVCVWTWFITAWSLTHHRWTIFNKNVRISMKLELWALLREGLIMIIDVCIAVVVGKWAVTILI
jgi:hypothetical protein